MRIMCSEQIMSGEYCICVNIGPDVIHVLTNVIYSLVLSTRRYDSFVNWDFFPCIQLPILVYFKETQTPKVGFVSCAIAMITKVDSISIIC